LQKKKEARICSQQQMLSRWLLVGVAGLAWLTPTNGFCGGKALLRQPVNPPFGRASARQGIGRMGASGMPLSAHRLPKGRCRTSHALRMTHGLEARPGGPGAEKADEGAKQASAYEDNHMYEREWVTPLWMITQEPDLNNLVKYLQEMRTVITDNPDQEHVLLFSRKQIEAAREAFSRMVRRGEMRLHRLSELTGSEIFCTRYSRQVVVVGQRNGPDGQGQRFQLVQPLSVHILICV